MRPGAAAARAQAILPTILLVLVAGCATPGLVAHRLVTAPNVAHKSASPNAGHWIAGLTGGADPFQYFNVPVGPPEAVLQVMTLPAGDYQVDVLSEVHTNRSGGKHFSLQMVPKTNTPPALCPAQGTIFLLPGYGLGKEVMLPWALVLAKAGYRTVLVDLRGHGGSTGRTFYCGKYEPADLSRVLDYLTAKGQCDGPVGALGISFGADVALLWCARDPRVRTVVAIAPYNHPEEALARFVKAMRMPISTHALQGGLRLAAAQLELNWADVSGESAMRRLRVPVLIIGGGKDTISPPGDLSALKDAAPAGSSRLVIPEANHFVIGCWFHGIAEPVKSWLQQHLRKVPPGNPQIPTSTP